MRDKIFIVVIAAVVKKSSMYTTLLLKDGRFPEVELNNSPIDVCLAEFVHSLFNVSINWFSPRLTGVIDKNNVLRIVYTLTLAGEISLYNSAYIWDSVNNIRDEDNICSLF